MFGSNKTEEKQNAASMSGGGSRISEGTVIDGNIKSAGLMRVDGQVNGTIHCSEKLVIGKSAIVKGDIYCKAGLIEGKVTGKVNVEGLLELKNSALIDGDISTQKLIIEEGARFNGACNMGSKSSNLNAQSGRNEAKAAAA